MHTVDIGSKLGSHRKHAQVNTKNKLFRIICLFAFLVSITSYYSIYGGQARTRRPLTLVSGQVLLWMFTQRLNSVSTGARTVTSFITTGSNDDWLLRKLPRLQPISFTIPGSSTIPAKGRCTFRRKINYFIPMRGLCDSNAIISVHFSFLKCDGCERGAMPAVNC